MDTNLKNALIIIGVLLVIYYWISPTQSCIRILTSEEHKMTKEDASFACMKNNSW